MFYILQQSSFSSHNQIEIDSIIEDINEFRRQVRNCALEMDKKVIIYMIVNNFEKFTFIFFVLGEE